MWAELPILARYLPRQTAVLIFVKPKFVRRSPHALKVVNAAMADQAFELFGDFIYREPILHVATEARPCRSDSLGVYVFKRLHGLESSNEIDKRTNEHRLDALVSDGQSPAFHLFCKTGYPGVCQMFSDGLQGTRVVLWFYGARWARDSLSVLVRVYQQAMQAHADMPVR